MNQSTTHFGNQTVAIEEKASLVRGVFDSVASKYDLMNDAMSAGLHRLWKHELVNNIPLYNNISHLDLAGGTGDIAFRLHDRLRSAKKTAHITICDINAKMLCEGTKRAIDSNYMHSFDWVCGNAESLPFPDESYDSSTIAFGIRNVTQIPLALKDIHRTLKPGGKFLCLEFSTVQNEILRRLYDEYSEHVIPQMGQILANDRASYEYLVQSIRKFPTPQAFSTMIEEAGFQRVSYKLMTGGVVALHTGWKL